MSSEAGIIVISAPSGAGKTTMREKLRQVMPDLEYSVSVTTRLPRKNEKEGEDYNFVDEECFRKMIKKSGFIEWAEVHGHLYGTPRDFVEKKLKECKDILFDLDVHGALEVKRQFPRVLLIFIAVPGIADLETRLRKRHTENSKDVKRRIEKAVEEMSYSGQYDCVIINEKFEDAFQKLQKIVREYRKYL